MGEMVVIVSMVADVEEKARLAQEIMGSGYQVKAVSYGLEILKVGAASGDPITKDDAERLEAAREAIGPGVLMRLVTREFKSLSSIDITVMPSPEVNA